jgi:hypothetical protein
MTRQRPELGRAGGRKRGTRVLTAGGRAVLSQHAH